jgi:hypothetical protein
MNTQDNEHFSPLITSVLKIDIRGPQLGVYPQFLFIFKSYIR